MKSSLPPRRLIPRWRPVSKTLETSEVESIQSLSTSKLRFDAEVFEDSVEAWRQNPTAGHLGDVIAFAGDDSLRPRISTIVNEAVRLGHAVSETQRSIFSELGPEEGELDEAEHDGRLGVQSRVAQLRKDLLVAPDNVFALLDLAQLQLAAGKQKAAERLLFTALNLAPNGRIVLRTAARFFVHLGDAERAHSLIARHPASKEDPWLMASEIALADAAQRPSTLLGAGRRLVKSSTRPSRQLAELAGAVAHRELIDGSVKNARAHLRLALEHPTDNVVAQALIDGRRMGLRLEEPAILQAVHRSAEAQMLEAWMSADVDASEAQAIRWHSEEPFSSRPLHFLTALNAMQGNYQKALEWVQRGLIADPADQGLLANLVFTQAALGEEALAESIIKRARVEGQKAIEPYLRATEGLIALRRRQFERARDHYRAAEQAFAKSGNESNAALCIAFYAKFASEFEAPDKEALKLEASDKVKRSPTIDGLILLGQFVHEPVAISAKEEDLRRLSQWVYDPDTNTLTQRLGVTAKGASAIVVQPSRAPGSRK